MVGCKEILYDLLYVILLIYVSEVLVCECTCVYIKKACHFRFSGSAQCYVSVCIHSCPTPREWSECVWECVVRVCVGECIV